MNVSDVAYITYVFFVYEKGCQAVNKLKTFRKPFIFKMLRALYYIKVPCLLYERNDISIGMVIEFAGVLNGE